MAASLRGTPLPPAPAAVTRVKAPDADAGLLAAAPHAYLARLAALHDEAAETAHLANLLGRAPWAAAALGTATLASAALAAAQSVSTTGLFIWLLLMGASVMAIARVYGRAIAAPFERMILKGFAHDLSAILLYAGFAWGAGLFLALPADTAIVPCVAFTAGLAIVLAIVVRTRDVALCFLVPATAMGAFAALMRPAAGNGATMLAILAGGLVAAGAAALLERWSAPGLPRAPQPL